MRLCAACLACAITVMAATTLADEPVKPDPPAPPAPALGPTPAPAPAPALAPAPAPEPTPAPAPEPTPAPAPELVSPPPWRPGEPIPRGYRRKRNSALITAGAVLFPCLWGTSLVSAAGYALFQGNKMYNWLAAPGFGPLVLMAQTQSAVGNVILAGDALGQASGLVLLFYGLATPKDELVKDEWTWRVIPTFAAGSAGASILGTF